jgi:hypothetical protein
MPRRQPLTIAILGSNTLAEHVLVLLLEDEGYIMRLLKAPHMGPPTVLPEGGSVDELLEGVDVVLLWPAPTLRDEAREAFVGATRSTPQTAAIPVLTLSLPRGCLAGRAGRRCAPEAAVRAAGADHKGRPRITCWPWGSLQGPLQVPPPPRRPRDVCPVGVCAQCFFAHLRMRYGVVQLLILVRGLHHIVQTAFSTSSDEDLCRACSAATYPLSAQHPSMDVLGKTSPLFSSEVR